MNEAGDLRSTGGLHNTGGLHLDGSGCETGGPDASVAAAYLFCRKLAQREARNFYWAFRVLPRYKSDAMCAVYAFMRRADDIADDESKSLETRRAEMTAWLSAWRAFRANRTSAASASPISFSNSSSNSNSENPDTPIFLALAHTQRRFAIPDELLEQLVSGTAMDLEPRTGQHAADDNLSAMTMPSKTQTYATFDDLYRYCYLVASVVGLVCIKIFGYTDPRAEKYAEETGVALQLTNILRDVKEDIERDRIYLPLDLLDEFGETLEELRTLAAGREMTARERAMLATLAIRAEKYYMAARKLLPLLERDSRAALWILVTIYHRLLGRIATHKIEVFNQRIALPTTEKLSILACGIAMTAWNRVTG